MALPTHLHSVLAALTLQSWVIAAETPLSTKPKIFITWSFAEKVCWPLLIHSSDKQNGPRNLPVTTLRPWHCQLIKELLVFLTLISSSCFLARASCLTLLPLINEKSNEEMGASNCFFFLNKCQKILRVFLTLKKKMLVVLYLHRVLCDSESPSVIHLSWSPICHCCQDGKIYLKPFCFKENRRLRCTWHWAEHFATFGEMSILRKTCAKWGLDKIIILETGFFFCLNRIHFPKSP